MSALNSTYNVPASWHLLSRHDVEKAYGADYKMDINTFALVATGEHEQPFWMYGWLDHRGFWIKLHSVKSKKRLSKMTCM